MSRVGSQNKAQFASGINSEMFGVQGRRLEFPKFSKYPYIQDSIDGGSNLVPNRLPKVGKGFSKVLNSISPLGVKTIGQQKAH